MTSCMTVYDDCGGTITNEIFTLCTNKVINPLIEAHKEIMLMKYDQLYCLYENTNICTQRGRELRYVAC